MSNLQCQFEAALKENRHDVATRLIYADWLDENNLPDEAAEQRRRTKPEWIEADKWMYEFASRGGVNIVNYGEHWYDLEERRRDLDYNNPEHRDEIQRTMSNVSKLATTI